MSFRLSAVKIGGPVIYAEPRSRNIPQRNLTVLVKGVLRNIVGSPLEMPLTTNSLSHRDDQIPFPQVCAIFHPLLVFAFH